MNKLLILVLGFCVSSAGLASDGKDPKALERSTNFYKMFRQPVNDLEGKDREKGLALRARFEEGVKVCGTNGGNDADCVAQASVMRAALGYLQKYTAQVAALEKKDPTKGAAVRKKFDEGFRGCAELGSTADYCQRQVESLQAYLDLANGVKAETSQIVMASNGEGTDIKCAASADTSNLNAEQKDVYQKRQNNCKILAETATKATAVFNHYNVSGMSASPNAKKAQDAAKVINLIKQAAQACKDNGTNNNNNPLVSLNCNEAVSNIRKSAASLAAVSEARVNPSLQRLVPSFRKR